MRSCTRRKLLFGGCIFHGLRPAESCQRQALWVAGFCERSVFLLDRKGEKW